MNNSNLLTYNSTLSLCEYKDTRTYVSGNIFSNNVDRISDVCDIYAFAFFDTQYIKLFTDEDRQAFCSYAILPNDEETMENTFPADAFKDIVPVGPIESGNPNVDQMIEKIDISFLPNQLFAENSITTGLSGLITMYLQNNDETSNEDGMFIDCIRYAKNNTSLGLYQVVRFIKHKIDFIFYASENDVYAFSDCDKLTGRVKIIKYTASGSDILRKSKIMYSCPTLNDYQILTPVPLVGNLTDIHILYNGELTTYKSINVKDDLDVILDGYANEYGSYSNVNNAIIQPNFVSNVEDGDSYPSFSLGYKYPSDNGTNEIEYKITNFGEIVPNEIFITYDESILNASINFRKNNNTGESIEVQLTNDIISSNGHFDVTQQFLNVFDPVGVIFSLKFSHLVNSIKENVQIMFHLPKIGKCVKSYVSIPNVGDSDIHEGQYSYTGLAGKTLHVYYTDYDMPFLKLYKDIGCFVKGTKILMANGTLKNIEDVQIGEYVLNNEGHAQKVIWNQPRSHKISNYCILYELPDGKSIGIIADERILWNGKFTFISSIQELKHTRITGEFIPYELWTTGNDTIIANGIICGKIYSGIKCKFIRNILKWFYNIIFLHNKDYKFINNIHTFISQKILKHKI